MNDCSYNQMKFKIITFCKRRCIKLNRQNLELCSCNILHSEAVNKVKEAMLPEESLYDLAELFKVFGDFTRIKIISVLLTSELCVCDIAHVLGMTQSAISHQLRILKQTRLVKYRKEGKVVFYSLDDEHIKDIFMMGFCHVSERKGR